MFSRLGPMEILLILAVALLIFGPSKLPQLGRSVGESLREFKRSMKGEEAKEESEKKGDETGAK
ncbi:MAG TPA: twin-arginine translocase TatA/TatE family subunit [Symbiobacteriaceae bacterium]|nr:twin-arginine translocase TatA/TatE family subunit [Symbiobacteriaceae bacterium]